MSIVAAANRLPISFDAGIGGGFLPFAWTVAPWLSTSEAQRREAYRKAGIPYPEVSPPAGGISELPTSNPPVPVGIGNRRTGPLVAAKPVLSAISDAIMGPSSEAGTTADGAPSRPVWETWEDVPEEWDTPVTPGELDTPVYPDWEVFGKAHPRTNGDDEMATTWGGLANAGIDFLQSQYLGGGLGPGRPAIDLPDPLEVPNLPAQITVDTRTGKVTRCKRRRRRRLLTPTDLSDLAALAAVVGKGDALKLAVAKAVRR